MRPSQTVYVIASQELVNVGEKKSQPRLPSSLVFSVHHRQHRVALRCCVRNNSGKNLLKQSTLTSVSFRRSLCTFFQNVLDTALSMMAMLRYQGKGEKRRWQELVNVRERESQLPNRGGTSHGARRSVQTYTHGHKAATLSWMRQLATCTDNVVSLWTRDVFRSRVWDRVQSTQDHGSILRSTLPTQLLGRPGSSILDSTRCDRG